MYIMWGTPMSSYNFKSLIGIASQAKLLKEDYNFQLLKERYSLLASSQSGNLQLITKHILAGDDISLPQTNYYKLLSILLVNFKEITCSKTCHPACVKFSPNFNFVSQ